MPGGEMFESKRARATSQDRAKMPRGAAATASRKAVLYTHDIVELRPLVDRADASGTRGRVSKTIIQPESMLPRMHGEEAHRWRLRLESVVEQKSCVVIQGNSRSPSARSFSCWNVRRMPFKRR
ncbi:hypothetical protein H310_03637 [Aphanomyces invadans]|uniref:Uncharacterized protein n=1 Tax=Aphanomyces invadans TaxID=157072 RepID=A0A024UK98_9STRA|nr:hypothetical protein H310_03637 [Aphanomyces invadans]ETW06028.1 hypothetical protein H310_03637 [Aphanomyces invadans]|eukprot:XP_008865805.1 hypothetical protein H310_03637 [Aphanomyces invadans]